MNVNYVISLVNADVRREHICNEFNNRNIAFCFFDALQPSSQLNRYIDTALPALKNARLSQGEKACFMSHWALWEKLLHEDKHYFTIFEDDVLLGNNAEKLFSDYQWLESRFDLNSRFIIRLETSCIAVKREYCDIESVLERQFTFLNSEEFGMAGYIISRNAVIFLMEYFRHLDSEAIKAVDKFLFGDLIQEENIKIYQLEPAICIQEDKFNKKKAKLTSQLENERQKVLALNKSPEKKSVVHLLYKLLTKWHRMKEKKRKNQERLNNMIRYE